MTKNGSFDLSTICVVLGIVGWASIVILSILPGAARPHTGVSGSYEHFVAYLLVGGTLNLGFRYMLPRLLVCIGLTATAVLLELVQTAIPGRTAEVSGAISGFAGAWIAMGIVSLKGLLETRT